MKKKTLLFTLTMLAVLTLTVPSFAATVGVSVDGKSVEVPVNFQIIGGQAKHVSFTGGTENALFRLTLSGEMNADPFILWSASATNFTALPMIFSYTFGTPVVGGPYNRLTASFGVTVTDLLGDGGSASAITSISTLVVPSGSVSFGPVSCVEPAPGIAETETCSFGPSSSVFAPYSPTLMSTTTTFTLSPLDSAGFSGATVLDFTPVPEPASLALVGLGLAGIATVIARRKMN